MNASEMWTMGRKMLDDMGTVDKRAERFLDPTPDEEATLRGLMRAAYYVGHFQGTEDAESEGAA